mgnify:FL=1
MNINMSLLCSMLDITSRPLQLVSLDRQCSFPSHLFCYPCRPVNIAVKEISTNVDQQITARQWRTLRITADAHNNLLM